MGAAMVELEGLLTSDIPPRCFLYLCFVPYTRYLHLELGFASAVLQDFALTSSVICYDLRAARNNANLCWKSRESSQPEKCKFSTFTSV